MKKALVLSLALLPALCAAVPAAAQGTRVYLTWRAPHGMPRAVEALTAPCVEDSSVRDTLFVSFQTGRDAPTFFGFEGALVFRPALGDTLGPNWFFGGGESNRRNVRVEWLRDSSTWAKVTSPWKMEGAGLVNFERTREVGRLRLMYAVPDGAPVRDGVTYGFARVIVPRALRGQASCNQPLCIEWADTNVAYELQHGGEVRGAGGPRFATLNGTTACREFQGARAVPTWKPPGAR
jgi:hypothetical protein